MGPRPSATPPSLSRSLTLMRQALARSDGQALAVPPAAPPAARFDLPALASLLGAGALAVAAVVSGAWWVLLPAAGLGAFAGLTLGQRLGRGPLTRGGTVAHIGMGADVAADATIEPGAAVEMGASVGAGAVVRRGAVVRMGADIQRGAVVEAGAIIDWGATVGADAVVGAGSLIGAGATVQPRARVAPETRLWPGGTVHAGAATALPVPPALPEDPRAARVRAVCDRLELELGQAPEAARAFLGSPGETVAALRHACEDLLRRERWLRAESEPQALAALDRERLALAARLEQATDEGVRGSLRGALAALEEQQRQRQLLRTGADRLEAEHSRLLYTLEGLATQVVRLRSAGAGVAGAENFSLEQGVAQLQAELDAIAGALEEVGRPSARGLEPVAELQPEGSPAAPTPVRER